MRSHGYTRDGAYPRIYRIWSSVKTRCLNPKARFYHRYGGRGITLCEAWHKFEGFVEWANASGYRDDLQIDRIDNSAGYSPENCRWVAPRVNSLNRRDNKRFSFFGKSLTLGEASDRYNVKRLTIRYRLSRGLTPEQAVTFPVGEGNKVRLKALLSRLPERTNQLTALTT